MTLKVLMTPQLESFGSDESGIRRVVEAYYRYAKEFDIEYLDKGRGDYDLTASHAGAKVGTDVAICHGLYFTADYEADKWEWGTNAEVIKSLRQALEITVPSNWVAETFKRDMRLSPHVIGHGIEWDEWQGESEKLPIVLWNKNRSSDVCNPTPVVVLAKKYPKIKFVTTFVPNNTNEMGNVRVIGLTPHNGMKQLIKSSRVYLATTKETFGIGVLEAMAAGVPILAFAHGGNLDLVQHGVNGYLAQPNNYDDLANGLEYCVAYQDVLGDNGREMAKQWTWRSACEKLRKVYDLALEDKTPIRTTLSEEEYTI
jgi:hypothetical protein